MHRVFRGLFSVGVAVVASTWVVAARADSGAGFGFGPLFAFSVSPDESVGIGWEAAASPQSFVFKATFGGSYYPRSWRDGTAIPPAFHYIAWEPWYIVGATLGVAATNQGQVRPVYGLWEGVLGSVSERDPFDLYDDAKLHWAVSLVAGWRGVGLRQEFYFTPKFWRIRGWDAFT